jgi:hypothetical protein
MNSPGGRRMFLQGADPKRAGRPRRRPALRRMGMAHERDRTRCDCGPGGNLSARPHEYRDDRPRI